MAETEGVKTSTPSGGRTAADTWFEGNADGTWTLWIRHPDGSTTNGGTFNPKDNVYTANEDGTVTVWLRNPDGSYTNGGVVPKESSDGVPRNTEDLQSTSDFERQQQSQQEGTGDDRTPADGGPTVSEPSDEDIAKLIQNLVNSGSLKDYEALKGGLSEEELAKFNAAGGPPVNSLDHQAQINGVEVPTGSWLDEAKKKQEENLKNATLNGDKKAHEDVLIANHLDPSTQPPANILSAARQAEINLGGVPPDSPLQQQLDEYKDALEKGDTKAAQDALKWLPGGSTKQPTTGTTEDTPDDVDPNTPGDQSIAPTTPGSGLDPLAPTGSGATAPTGSGGQSPTSGLNPSSIVAQHRTDFPDGGYSILTLYKGSDGKTYGVEQNFDAKGNLVSEQRGGVDTSLAEAGAGLKDSLGAPDGPPSDPDEWANPFDTPSPPPLVDADETGTDETGKDDGAGDPNEWEPYPGESGAGSSTEEEEQTQEEEEAQAELELQDKEDEEDEDDEATMPTDEQSGGVKDPFNLLEAEDIPSPGFHKLGEVTEYGVYGHTPTPLLNPAAMPTGPGTDPIVDPTVVNFGDAAPIDPHPDETATEDLSASGVEAELVSKIQPVNPQSGEGGGPILGPDAGPGPGDPSPVSSYDGGPDAGFGETAPPVSGFGPGGDAGAAPAGGSADSSDPGVPTAPASSGAEPSGFGQGAETSPTGGTTGSGPGTGAQGAATTDSGDLVAPPESEEAPVAPDMEPEAPPEIPAEPEENPKLEAPEAAKEEAPPEAEEPTPDGG